MLPPSADLIDRMLAEDVPYGDLTSRLLALPEVPGRLSVSARGELVAAGTPFAVAVCERVGLSVTHAVRSGSVLADGAALLIAEGPAPALHLAWKLLANLYETAYGIATRTRALVAAAAPAPVFATRKVVPGTKALASEAILAGGALPHRLGLSESVLVFDQHIAFLGGIEALAARLPELTRRACEKVVLVEVSTLSDALSLAAAGVGGLQFDKLADDELRRVVVAVRAAAPAVRLIAAGGITAGTAAAYAATGVDALASSWMYAGREDVGVTIAPI